MGCVMITRLKLKPGQKGTKKLVEKYGDTLICVRYRYDEAHRMRIKTVELAIEKTAWSPPAQKFIDDDIVPVQISFADNALRERAKAAKGRWNPEMKLWFIRYGKIKGTALEKHIILDAFSKQEKTKSI